MLVPLRKDILFSFIDNVKNGYINDKTSWGFEIEGSHETTGSSGRWGKVLAIGPDLIGDKDIIKNQYIFVTPLMWTIGFNFKGTEIWKTDATKVMCVSKDFPC